MITIWLKVLPGVGPSALAGGLGASRRCRHLSIGIQPDLAVGGNSLLALLFRGKQPGRHAAQACDSKPWHGADEGNASFMLK